MADCQRCGADVKRLECFLQAAIRFFKCAADSYDARVAKFRDNSDKYKLYSAKAAEMRAKREELMILAGDESVEGSHGNSGDPRERCAQAWGEVIDKKPSYDAYAKAKRLEYSSKDPSEIAAAWEAVKHDKDLKESFSEDSWEAYEAFAEANRQEWLLKAGQSSKEQLHHAWMQAYEKDEICANKLNSLVYHAFAAEARQRAQDALKG